MLGFSDGMFLKTDTSNLYLCCVLVLKGLKFGRWSCYGFVCGAVVVDDYEWSCDGDMI